MIDIRIENLGNADFSDELGEFINELAENVPIAFNQLTDESDPAGRWYGKHQASAEGQVPARWTGRLTRDIQTTKRGKFRSTVTFSAPYAGIVEKLRPFTFLTVERTVKLSVWNKI